MKDLTLSTGHKIPKGWRMAFNQRAVHTSTSTETYSPEYNPPENKPPHEFDGFRFYNLRNMPGKSNKHMFVTVNPESLTFGYGVHACPGRFFAINEMKVILVELIRNYDFRMADPSQNSDSMRHLRDLLIVPPREANIQLKLRLRKN
jgi:cytochrome P450